MCLSVSWTRYFFLTDLCLEISPSSAHFHPILPFPAMESELHSVYFFSHRKLKTAWCLLTPTVNVQDLHPSLNFHTLGCCHVNTECIDATRYLSTCLPSSSWIVFLYFYGACHMLEAGHPLCLTGLSGWGWEMKPWGELPVGTARCSWALALAQAMPCRASSSLCLWGASQEGLWGFL